VAAVLGSLPMQIVDDSVSILKMTKRAILNSHESMSFIEAKNGQEAFEQVVLLGDSFELIVTDIQMPICDGFEFTRMVRKLELEKNLPPKIIIGISANDQEKIADEAKESGMDGFMHKPFKLTTLMEVIGDISNRRKKVMKEFHI
jgi:CheY-like chemotaxis protein